MSPKPVRLLVDPRSAQTCTKHRVQKNKLGGKGDCFGEYLYY